MNIIIRKTKCVGLKGEKKTNRKYIIRLAANALPDKNRKIYINRIKRFHVTRMSSESYYMPIRHHVNNLIAIFLKFYGKNNFEA